MLYEKELRKQKHLAKNLKPTSARGIRSRRPIQVVGSCQTRIEGILPQVEGSTYCFVTNHPKLEIL